MTNTTETEAKYVDAICIALAEEIESIENHVPKASAFPPQTHRIPGLRRALTIANNIRGRMHVIPSCGCGMVCWCNPERDALIVKQIARTAAIGVSCGCGHAQYIDFAIADAVVAALVEAGLVVA